jgi:amino acid transporter
MDTETPEYRPGVAAEPPGTSTDAILDAGKADDTSYLQQLGYKQELNRRLGEFASFAVLFSIIGVSISIFTLFGYGLTTVGPLSVIAFIIGGGLQMAVGLSIAELVSAYPIAGGAYQIVNRIIGGVLAWQTGWLLVIALVVSVAANGSAIGLYVSQIFNLGTLSTPESVGIAFALIILITAFNLIGVRFSSFINNVGVVAELGGLSVIVILLMFKGFIHPISFVTNSGSTGTSWTNILPFLYAFLFPVYMINAFDSTGHTGEETHDAAVKAPRGAVTANFAAWIYGTFALIILMLEIPNLAKATGSAAPLTYIVSERLGTFFSDALTVVVIISFFVASQMLQLTAARIFWAQARDKQFPIADWLRKVSSHRVPANATLIVAVIAAVFVLFSNVLAVLAAMVALAFSVANFITVGAGMVAKRRHTLPRHPWNYGPWGTVFDVIALVWNAFLVVILIYQNPRQVGLGFGVVVVAGFVIYYVGIPARHRGVLPTATGEPS